MKEFKETNQSKEKPDSKICRYTLDDLEKARERLKSLNDAYANDSSNNPNKYRSDIEIASSDVRLIRYELINAGLIEMTEKEKLQADLDKLYPNAKSKSVVEYKGKKYKICYWPIKSRSGKTVQEWRHRWEELDE